MQAAGLSAAIPDVDCCQRHFSLKGVHAAALMEGDRLQSRLVSYPSSLQGQPKPRGVAKDGQWPCTGRDAGQCEGHRVERAHYGRRDHQGHVQRVQHLRGPRLRGVL